MKKERGNNMNKKRGKYVLILLSLVILIIAITNTYKWIVCGKQDIKISTSSKAYTNSDMYVSIISQKNDVELETKTKVKLLNSDKKTVKGVTVSYEGNEAKISVPEVESGNYYIEAKVSSKEGKDTVQKQIYIEDGNRENITLAIDKGIYKPRRHSKL